MPAPGQKPQTAVQDVQTAGVPEGLPVEGVGLLFRKQEKCRILATPEGLGRAGARALPGLWVTCRLDLTHI